MSDLMIPARTLAQLHHRLAFRLARKEAAADALSARLRRSAALPEAQTAALRRAVRLQRVDILKQRAVLGALSIKA